MKESVLLLLILIFSVSAVLLGLFIVSRVLRRAPNEKKKEELRNEMFSTSNEKKLEELRSEMFQIFSDVKERLKSGAISRNSAEFWAANERYKKLLKSYSSMGGKVIE